MKFWMDLAHKARFRASEYRYVGRKSRNRAFMELASRQYRFGLWCISVARLHYRRVT